MKIALIEPLGVPEQTIDRLSAPLKDAGHEFVYFDTKPPIRPSSLDAARAPRSS